MRNERLDATLQELYVEFDTPADQMLASPQAADEFVDRLNSRMDLPVEKEVIFTRLLNLRKGGHLPRLRRR